MVNELFTIDSAEMETHAKVEKVSQIKHLHSHIMNVRGEVAKLEDKLKEYQKYKRFLFSIAPMVGDVIANFSEQR